MPSRKLRVLIANSRGKDPLYRITPDQWRAACMRHRGLAKRLDASIGWDGKPLDTALADAVAVVGVPARHDRLAERAPALKWLHSTSAGVDGLLPLDWLPAGVAFTNNRGAHAPAATQTPPPVATPNSPT